MCYRVQLRNISSEETDKYINTHGTKSEQGNLLEEKKNALRSFSSLKF